MAGFDSRRTGREVKPVCMGRSQGVIVKLNTLLAVCCVGVDESCTVKVGLYTPAVPAAGVPVISPVEAFKLSPVGSAGVTDHVNGARPPER